MDKSVILFDLDGTLADNSHRQTFVTNGNKDWDSFFLEQVNDVPNKPVVNLFHSLNASNRHRIFVVTARPSNFMSQTSDWLTKYGIFPERIIMRNEGDRRSDIVVKKEMLAMLRNEGLEPLMVIDDRTSVVEMWRKEGVTCLQCANHNF